MNALAWHALEEDETARRVLGDRPLVIVRLRDLNTKEITRQEGLLPALLAYLKIPNIKTLRARFPKAVLVLDGFDELCLMEGYTEGEDLLYHLCRERLEDYKVIVTSRPNYIRKNLSQRIIPHSGVELLHFKEDKKREWIERFTGDCGQPLKETVQKFILENREEGVSDTPLTLYLFASSDVREEELQNQWALYNRIFFEELTQRQYDNADHPKSFNGWKEAAYQAAGEVAHRMYCTKSEQVRLEGNELDSLKSALALRVKLLEADLQEIIAHSTALCSYWRVTKDRGMVEFYHNNIRDFFLCEWIYTLLNGIYTDREKNEAEKVEALSFFFRDHFRAGGLAERVCTFLYLRACQKKSDDFPAMEREMHLLPRFFERLLTDGKLYDGLHEKHLPTIVSILRCAAQVYRAVLEPFRGEKERIRWWESVDAVNESGMLRYLFSDVFSPHDYFLFDPNRLKCLDPEPAYLSPTDFADFSKLQIAKAYLRGADLRGADLSAADLRGADLRWADLSGAILSSADLIGVILRAANLIGAYLIRADLSGADLCKADLSTAKARWAHLQDAILPDGFKSDDQEKQIAHLRSLNIKGLEL
ncbi:MAG: pentapeptide repeat-containing protein [bacterium]